MLLNPYCKCKDFSVDINYWPLYFTKVSRDIGVPDEMMYMGMTCKICGKPKEEKKQMTNLEKLIKARSEVETAITKLRTALYPMEPSINVLLLDKGKYLNNSSVSEVLQITNLLIHMLSETKDEEDCKKSS